MESFNRKPRGFLSVFGGSWPCREPHGVEVTPGGWQGGDKEGGRQVGSCSLHPACLSPCSKLAAACRMQMEKMQFVGKCPLINNLGVFSLSGGDILHFSSLPHQPKTFNDVVLLPGCAAHAKYLQPHKMVGGEPSPAPAPRPAPFPSTSPQNLSPWHGEWLSTASPARPGGRPLPWLAGGRWRISLTG